MMAYLTLDCRGIWSVWRAPSEAIYDTICAETAIPTLAEAGCEGPIRYSHYCQPGYLGGCDRLRHRRHDHHHGCGNAMGVPAVAGLVHPAHGTQRHRRDAGTRVQAGEPSGLLSQ